MFFFSRWFWFGLVGIGAGVLLLLLSQAEAATAKQLEQDGEVVAGTIVAGEVAQRRRGSTSYLTVSYPGVKQGEKLTGEFEVTSDFYEAHVRDEKVIKALVEIRRSQSVPTAAQIVGGAPERNALLAYAPFGVGVLMIVGSFFDTGKKAASE